MNKIYSASLKIGRKLYLTANPDSTQFSRNWKLFSNKEYANKIIYDALTSKDPCMIARFGSTEMLALMNHWGVHNLKESKSIKRFIKGQTPPWWWERSMVHQMQNWSGFFPPTVDHIEKFCALMLNVMPQVDILGSWLKQEEFFRNNLKNARRVVLEDLEPFFCTNPWTRALEGKKVLVVHPFSETIESQYQKRELLFTDNLLPKFELKTIKAVQSIAGNKTEFADWFEALDSMKAKIDATDYDICILGCGAYGFPLAAHIKAKGKKAFHLAGATQLLFGIIGKRWETYIVWPYMNLFNEHWVRPGQNEKPKNASIVEDSCYW
jgi:hypothetical protein